MDIGSVANPLASKGRDRASYVPGPDRYSIGHRSSTRSTARSSIASITSSILSRSLSTASTALSRYSSVRSAADSELVFTSPISPWSSYPEKECADLSRSYWCTLCQESFKSSNEWKSHELDCQDAHLPRAAPVDVAVNTVRPSAQRGAWGCGFCASYSQSLPEYLDHVGGHYDERRVLYEWQHSSVIKGLLRQPDLEDAWRALLLEKGHVAGDDDTFFWDSRITGRSSPGLASPTSPGLQDLLECFSMAQMKPQLIAKTAYELACVTAPDYDQAEDTIDEPSISNNAVPASAFLLPENRNQQTAFTGSYTLPEPGSARGSPQGPSKIYVKVEGATSNQPPVTASGSAGLTISAPHKRGVLRRIDSERNLSTPRAASVVATAAPRPADGPFLDITETSSPSIPDQQSASGGRASPMPAVRELPGEGQMNLLVVTELNEASSIRSHSNSSVLSARTGNQSMSHDDSAGELVSNDSASEPDLQMEVVGNPAASREWRRVYHQTVETVMEQLWSQYNDDWDQMIRSHAGGSSNHQSRGNERESSRRGQGSRSSRHGSGWNLRPGSRHPIEGDDEEEDNRHPGNPNASSSKSSLTGGTRFVCPFRKHDPQTYNLHDHQVCTVHTWPTIPRLKEHLYRKHYIVHCQRCKRVFPKDKDLEAHEMAPEGCIVRDIRPPCDITTAQEKWLKSRSAKNRPKHLTPKEKWEEIYRLLFPDDTFTPSPYPEYTEDLGPISPESRESLGIQHYLLVRMPELFRRAAEEYLGGQIQAGEVLRTEAISTIIQNSLNKAFREYEESNGRVTAASSQPTPSPLSFGSFTTNDPSHGVSPLSPSTMPPWSSSEMSQLDATYTSRTMQPAATWPSISSGLTPMPLATSDGLNWLAPTTTATFGSMPYEPCYPSTSGMADASFGTYDPTSHGDPYTNDDMHMTGEPAKWGDQSYF
ncbi:hypothetical protein V8F33_007502 [Rhypophila sp. PSN 637]